MKVVQINSACGNGSTGKIALAISKLLTDSNVENYVFYSGNHKSDYEHAIMIAPKLSIRLHQILSRIFGDQGFHSYFSTKRMVNKIKKISPDAILLHNLHGYYLHMGVLFKFLKEYGRPVYWTFHDCWPFTGHCTHFTVEKCTKWKNGCNHCAYKHKYPYSWFFDRSKKLYNKKKKLFTSLDNLTIITPSKWLAKLVKESFFCKYPVEIIHNGINLRTFKPAKSSLKDKYQICDKKTILGVSSVWSYYKGLDVFCELATRLEKDKYQIVLVGTDDSVDSLLPEGVISIHRTQDQNELVKIYSAADVFVNPTREENYPTVNMEAIACGTPVVTFNTGGCAEIVIDGCGHVVEVDSVEQMEKQIRRVAENASDYKRSLEDKAQLFDEQICLKKYVELIVR